MLWNILTGLVLDNWQWIVGAVGILAAALGIRKSGKDAVRASQAKDAAKRSEKGRKAAGKAAADIRKGKTPDDVARDNDGAWGQ